MIKRERCNVGSLFDHQVNETFHGKALESYIGEVYAF